MFLSIMLIHVNLLFILMFDIPFPTEEESRCSYYFPHYESCSNQHTNTCHLCTSARGFL